MGRHMQAGHSGSISEEGASEERWDPRDLPSTDSAVCPESLCSPPCAPRLGPVWRPVAFQSALALGERLRLVCEALTLSNASLEPSAAERCSRQDAYEARVPATKIDPLSIKLHASLRVSSGLMMMSASERQRQSLFLTWHKINETAVGGPPILRSSACTLPQSPRA